LRAYSDPSVCQTIASTRIGGDENHLRLSQSSRQGKEQAGCSGAVSNRLHLSKNAMLSRRSNYASKPGCFHLAQCAMPSKRERAKPIRRPA
jgi:hypothetical protein